MPYAAICGEGEWYVARRHCGNMNEFSLSKRPVIVMVFEYCKLQLRCFKIPAAANPRGSASQERVEPLCRIRHAASGGGLAKERNAWIRISIASVSDIDVLSDVELVETRILH